MNTTLVRRSWIVVGSLVAAGALAVYTTLFVSALARADETVVRTYDGAAVDTVSVQNDNGSVEVLGGDVDRIEVTAEVDHGYRATRFDAEVVGRTLELRSGCPVVLALWCGVRYRIVVPTSTDVVADTRNGRLVVHDVAGSVRLDSRNRAVDVARLSGDVAIETANGAIRAAELRSTGVRAVTRNGAVDLSFTEAPTSVTAESRNGAVDVVVPPTGHAYRVEVDTRHGSTDNAVRTDPASDRSITARTSNGGVTVRYAGG